MERENGAEPAVGEAEVVAADLVAREQSKA
jgi:hypothetical protein